MPFEWKPSVDISEEGTPSASPKVLLDGQDLWKNKDHDHAGAFVWPAVKVPVLTPLSVGQLRATSHFSRSKRPRLLVVSMSGVSVCSAIRPWRF
eukprot:6227968-Heterocapsa_arctica.AAC.1